MRGRKAFQKQLRMFSKLLDWGFTLFLLINLIDWHFTSNLCRQLLYYQSHVESNTSVTKNYYTCRHIWQKKSLFPFSSFPGFIFLFLFFQRRRSKLHKRYGEINIMLILDNYWWENAWKYPRQKRIWYLIPKFWSFISCKRQTTS